MGAPIHEAFGAQGLLAGAIDGYQVRPGQIALAEAVSDAIRERRHLLVEAPGGTGRTAGWAVPASWYAAVEGGQVVVATGGFAEQERLLSHDLPQLAACQPWGLDCARLEGLGGYVCLARLARVREDADVSPGGQQGTPALRELLAWAEGSETGCVADLAERPCRELWSLLSASSEECPGERCAHFDRCFARLASERAREARVVVTRYPVLLAVLQAGVPAGEPRPLAGLDVVVLEQAHVAADVARTCFGWRVGVAEVQRVAWSLRELGLGWLAEALEREAAAFCRDLAQLRRSDRYDAHLAEPDLIPSRPLARRLRMAGQYLEQAAVEAEAAGEPVAAELHRRRVGRCNTLAAWVGEGISLSDPDMVVSVAEDGWGRGVLESRYLDAGALLRELLFDPARAVIVTSDTLAAGGSFSLVRHELGVPEPVELVVEPPTAALRECPLLVPAQLPEPGERGWVLAVARTVAEVARAVPGRVLVLLMAGANLDLVQRSLRGVDRPVHVEGSASPRDLLRDLASEPQALLLCTTALWDAHEPLTPDIDCVVLDRLPFAGADDPVLGALRQRDPRWFGHVGLPRAVLALRRIQQAARRVDGEPGALVVLDRRLLDKPYGRFFMRSIQPARLVRELAELLDLLSDPQRRSPLPGEQP